MKTINIAIIVLCLMMSVSSNNSKESKETSAVASVSTDDAGKETTRITFTNEQYQLTGIETGKIKLMNISDMVKLNGMVDVSPGNRAVISAPLGGYIRSVGFVLGQKISKG